MQKIQIYTCDTDENLGRQLSAPIRDCIVPKIDNLDNRFVFTACY